MNRNWPVVVAAALLSFFAASLHAGGLYLGAGLGVASVKDTVDTATLDSEDTSVKAFIGWRFNIVPILDLAIEGAYTDFGKPTETVSAQRVEYKLHGPSAAGLVIFPIGPVDFYGKAGALNWHSDTTIGGSTSSKSGTDPFYGAGIGFNIGPFGLRAEYERFKIKDVDRIQMYSLSALFQF